MRTRTGVAGVLAAVALASPAFAQEKRDEKLRNLHETAIERRVLTGSEPVDFQVDTLVALVEMLERLHPELAPPKK